MRTVSPVPLIKDFIRLFFPKLVKDAGAYIRALKHKRDNAIFWTQRTRHSIFLVSKWHQQKFGIKPTFFVPDYFCHDALDLLDKEQMRFYRVNEQLNPDLQDCAQQHNLGRIDYFVLPHYFGNPNVTQEIKDFCARYEIYLIEDCAHVFRPNNGIGEVGDISLYSPHKFLPISDGAAIVIHHKSKLIQHGILDFLAKNTTPNMDLPTAWIIKKMIQRILRFGSRVKAGSFPPQPVELSKVTTVNHENLGISKFASKYIENIDSNEIEKIESSRQSNLLAWRKYFQGFSAACGFKIKILNQPSTIPYVCALECERAEFLFDLLAKANLCPQPWPNLDARIVNRAANLIRQNLILLPLHHDWDSCAVVENYSKLLQEFSTKIEISPSTHFPENSIDLESSATLLQTQPYFKAKQVLEGEASHQIYLGMSEKCIGYLVCKIKKIGPVRIIFINRGPVVQNGEDFFKFALLAAFLRRFSIWRMNLVLFQPEIEENDFSRMVARKMRWFLARRVMPVTHSSVLDLSISLDDLRKNLNSKWRNLLKKAEAGGIEISIQSDGFQDYLSRYQEFRQEKSFGGIQNDFLSAYYESCRQDQKPILITAQKSSEWLGGIVVTRNFPNSVYLLSVNTPAGREACANYLLLWSAVCYLKEKNFSSFDLGGFDDIRTPQITHFKRQIGGREYKLVGPFVKVI